MMTKMIHTAHLRTPTHDMQLHAHVHTSHMHAGPTHCYALIQLLMQVVVSEATHLKHIYTAQLSSGTRSVSGKEHDLVVSWVHISNLNSFMGCGQMSTHTAVTGVHLGAVRPQLCTQAVYSYLNMPCSSRCMLVLWSTGGSKISVQQMKQKAIDF